MLCLGAEVGASGRHEVWGRLSKELGAARQLKHKGGKETGKEGVGDRPPKQSMETLVGRQVPEGWRGPL